MPEAQWYQECDPLGRGICVNSTANNGCVQESADRCRTVNRADGPPSEEGPQTSARIRELNLQFLAFIGELCRL